MNRLNQEAVDFLGQLDSSNGGAGIDPSAPFLFKSATESHWRTLPSHFQGEDEEGNPVYGKTWVDREEKTDEEEEVWTTESFEKEGKEVAFLGFSGDGDVVYGRPSKKGVVVFKFTMLGAEAFETSIRQGYSVKSDEMYEAFQVMETSGDLSIHFMEGSRLSKPSGSIPTMLLVPDPPEKAEK